MAVCPSGHTSETADYCDQCGARIEASGASGPAATPASTAIATADPVADSGATACPNCGAPHDTGTQFCEDCGWDFVAGALPAGAAKASASASDAAVGPAWVAVISADRAYYDRVADESVTFPDGTRDRTIELHDADVLIGRHSESKGIHPQIDLGATPEDVAVSRRHATLVRQPDGSYALVDGGSTNGTFVNESETPIAPNTPTAVHSGDRVYVGAWTKITLISR